MAKYESVIELTVVSRAIEAGWFVRKVEWIGRRGAPDRVFIKGGRTVWIEFKDQGKRPEPHQEAEHARLRMAGAEVWVCDRVENAMSVLGLL